MGDANVMALGQELPVWSCWAHCRESFFLLLCSSEIRPTCNLVGAVSVRVNPGSLPHQQSWCSNLKIDDPALYLGSVGMLVLDHPNFRIGA
jgi:hypothetical protein